MKNYINSLFTLLLILGIVWVVYQTTYVDPTLIKIHDRIELHLKENPDCKWCKEKITKYPNELKALEDELGISND